MDLHSCFTFLVIRPHAQVQHLNWTEFFSLLFRFVAFNSEGVCVSVCVFLFVSQSIAFLCI